MGTAGERVRRARRDAGMTQEQLSRALGISTSYLRSIERGCRSVSRFFADKFCSYFQLSYDYLYTGCHPLPPALLFPDAQRQEISRRLFILINTCTPEDLLAIYQMCSHYLTARRDKSQFRPGAQN